MSPVRVCMRVTALLSLSSLVSLVSLAHASQLDSKDVSSGHQAPQVRCDAHLPEQHAHRSLTAARSLTTCASRWLDEEDIRTAAAKVRPVRINGHEMAVAVVHYAPLTDRRTRLTTTLTAAGIADDSTLWLDMYPRKKVTSDVTMCLFGPKRAPFADNFQATVATLWSQYAAYVQMVRAGWPYMLVLSDDVDFRMPPATLRSKLENIVGCMGNPSHEILHTQADVLHLGDIDTAHIVTQAGAQKLLHQLVALGAKGGQEAVHLHPAGADVLFYILNEPVGQMAFKAAGCAPLRSYYLHNQVGHNAGHGSHVNETWTAPPGVGAHGTSLLRMPSLCPRASTGVDSDYGLPPDLVANFKAEVA